jgi:tetratricopeptide (TPR) repeat protein
VLLATAPAVNAPDARYDIGEAIRLAREIHSPPEEAWGDWTLGLLYMFYGHFGEAMGLVQAGLQIATEIGHQEWIVGNRFALGVLLTELYAPNKARRDLEQTLELARKLRSQYWIHHVIGALAAAHIASGDLESAQTSLDSVISSQTPMDTMGKRYCWARKAQLAVAQGELDQALDIVERLIDSTPGSPAGCVVTFLWKIKGEILAAFGQPDEAILLFQEAIENARAQGEQYLLWRVHASLGRLYLKQGLDAKASDEVTASKALVEGLALSISDPNLKHGFIQGANQLLNF